MIKEKYFPTVIYGEDLTLDNNVLSQNIIEWSKQNKGLKKTNIKGWHSPTDMAIKPEYNNLTQSILNMAVKVFDEELIARKPIIGNMWANINYLSAHNKPHTHPNSFFSGLYYVKTPNDCGRLTLEDPRPGPQHLMPVKKPGTLPKDFWKTLFIEPKEGRLIIFPSWLWHSVEENKSFNDRISVSFNILQEGFNV